MVHGSWALQLQWLYGAFAQKRFMYDDSKMAEPSTTQAGDVRLSKEYLPEMQTPESHHMVHRDTDDLLNPLPIFSVNKDVSFPHLFSIEDAFHQFRPCISCLQVAMGDPNINSSVQMK